MSRAVSQKETLSDVLDRALLRMSQDQNEPLRLFSLSKQFKGPNRRRDEVRVYAGIDPVMARLYKDKQDAKARYQQHIDMFGKDDAMADVALDILESSESALETRLIELRRDPVKSLRAKLQIAQAERILREKKDKKQEHRFQYLKNIKDNMKRRAQVAAEESYFMGWVWVWLIQEQFYKAQRDLSLVHSFDRAVSAVYGNGG